MIQVYKKGVFMKQLLIITIAVMSLSIAHAQDSSEKQSVATPSTGVDAGKPSKEQRKAMHEELKDERSAVDSACVEEAKAANCGDKIVGKGLLKCIHQHKKASADFKISDSCKEAMKNLKSERHKMKK